MDNGIHILVDCAEEHDEWGKYDGMNNLVSFADMIDPSQTLAHIIQFFKVVITNAITAGHLSA